MNSPIDPRLKDKEWRISHLYKIVDKNSRLITFKRNAVQQKIAKEKHTRNIYLKARQEGVTTEKCIDYLDEVLFHNNITAVIIAHDKEAVVKIFKKVKLAWEHFPLKDVMGYVANTETTNELSFNNGSSIRVALSSRADTVNRLHISEFGKICAKYPLKSEEIITGAIPSVPENGQIDIESTAEGEYGRFYDMFWEAWNRGEPQAKKQFKAHFFPWTANPEYRLAGTFDIPQDLRDYQKLHSLTDEQINWYFIEKQTQKEKMKQEYPITPEEAFIGSGNKLFDSEKVSKIATKDGERVGDWIYYEDYIPSHRYALGADVAEGVGQDSSTGVIVDFTKTKVVAEYASNKIAPDMFAYELKNGATRYGNCLIAPERNNHGFTTLSKLKEIYHNIYTQKPSEDEIKVAQASNTQPKKKYGWLTTGATKPKMLFDLNDAINEDQIAIQSKYLKEELRTYDKEDLSVVRFDSNQTKHWDRVIALAICWQMKIHLQDNDEENEGYIFKNESY